MAERQALFQTPVVTELAVNKATLEVRRKSEHLDTPKSVNAMSSAEKAPERKESNYTIKGQELTSPKSIMVSQGP